mgnify:CR=1 FL=1|tara:strand:+ start:431 stop:1075 length:645 start_codon:yes stop_codon:yes gene_type:complete
MAKEKQSVYETLSKIDVSKMTETKGHGNFKATYLSWTHAWHAVKSNYPEATFEKKIFNDNQDNPLPFMRDTKGNTWVEVSVTIEGITIPEVFPVLGLAEVNGKKRDMQPLKHPDSFQVNTAHQRCLTKALAYHGLGINIYAGEDLPMETSNVEILDEYKDKADSFVADIKKAKDEKALNAIAKKISDAKLPTSLKGNVETAFRNKRSQLKDKAS